MLWYTVRMHKLHTTRKNEVKKAIIIASISVLTVASIGTATLATRSQEQPQAQGYTAVEAPESFQPVEVAIETPIVEEVPQNAPESAVETVPSNEQLISQYGWTAGSNRESIDYIIWMFPKRFTEEERVNSFAYLHAVSISNKVVGTEPKTINSIDFVRWYFHEHFMDESWVNVGILAEVDASLYE